MEFSMCHLELVASKECHILFKCNLIVCKDLPHLINGDIDYYVGLSMPPLIAWIWQ